MTLPAKQTFGASDGIIGESSSDGTLIVDVPVEEAMLGRTVSEQVFKEADLPSELLYSLNPSSVSSSRESVRRAGPTRSPVFDTSNYLPDQLDASETSQRFGKSVKYSQSGDLKDLNLR